MDRLLYIERIFGSFANPHILKWLVQDNLRGQSGALEAAVKDKGVKGKREN